MCEYAEQRGLHCIEDGDHAHVMSHSKKALAEYIRNELHQVVDSPVKRFLLNLTNTQLIASLSHISRNNYKTYFHLLRKTQTRRL